MLGAAAVLAATTAGAAGATSPAAATAAPGTPAAPATAAATGAAAPPVVAAGSTRTPIQHFVSVIQVGHTFDNYFGTYPGANGLVAGTCVPASPDRARSGCVTPYAVRGREVRPIPQTPKTFADTFRAGHNDGAVQTARRTGVSPGQPMGYYTAQDIPYYWNVADRYVLMDHFFSSVGDGSEANRRFWVAAPGDRSGTAPAATGTHRTIFDALQAAGVPWTFYVDALDPRLVQEGATKPGDKSEALAHLVSLLGSPRLLSQADLRAHLAPMSKFYTDAQAGTLPAVSYVMSADPGLTERPPVNIPRGMLWVRQLHTEVLRSPQWSTSAVLLAYDSWGGWYDHVAPPKGPSGQLGYRVPALLVSPYAPAGKVVHTQLDLSAGADFIAYNWRLPEAKAPTTAPLTAAFDFSAPRPPYLPSADPPRATSTPPSPQRTIYLTYGAGVTVPAIALTAGFAAWRALRRRRRGAVA